MKVSHVKFISYVQYSIIGELILHPPHLDTWNIEKETCLGYLRFIFLYLSLTVDCMQFPHASVESIFFAPMHCDNLHCDNLREKKVR